MTKPTPAADPVPRALGVPPGVLIATFLFNLGQGVLRPAMPLYLQRAFMANYRMVTLIPVVFGVGKWVTNLPSGYAMDRLGRRALMCFGLLVIAVIDLLSIVTSDYRVFLALRAAGGAGWAMFATVATTISVGGPASERRGRAVSILLMCETLGLLLGSTTGGWFYQAVGAASPFFLEAACLLVASIVLARAALPRTARRTPPAAPEERPALALVLRTPGVVLMAITNAALIGIQTGIMVFLFPLYLVNNRDVGPGMVGMFVSLTAPNRPHRRPSTARRDHRGAACPLEDVRRGVRRPGPSRSSGVGLHHGSAVADGEDHTDPGLQLRVDRDHRRDEACGGHRPRCVGRRADDVADQAVGRRWMNVEREYHGQTIEVKSYLSIGGKWRPTVKVETALTPGSIHVQPVPVPSDALLDSEEEADEYGYHLGVRWIDEVS